MYDWQVRNLLQQINAKVDKLMSQQDEINADVAELQVDDTAIAAENAKLEAAQAAGQPLDLTALTAAVAATPAIVPPAAG